MTWEWGECDDVTGECVWEDDELAHHHDDLCTDVTEANGYVVSRVRIDEIHDEIIGARYAFIVYRKKNQ